uniref:RAD51 paralog D n=1 Tax=Suricata suricatta TaxID=37032 RepID=A0A673UZ86_SURSU
MPGEGHGGGAPGGWGLDPAPARGSAPTTLSPRGQQVALQSRPWRLEGGSAAWRELLGCGAWTPRGRPLRAVTREPSGKRCRQVKGEGPADARGTTSPEPGVTRTSGNMGVLRAGLCPGLTQDTVQLLRSRGIKTVVDLVSADLEDVAQKCGLSYKALVALRRVLLAQFSAFPFNGADLYEELKTSTAILSTGIASLDKLLDAGLYTGEVTEIVGGPGSGKTQAGALQRIQVVRAFDIFQMFDVLQDLRGAVSQPVSSASTVKVVVVDSVTAVVSPLLGGQQREGLALMMQLSRELKTLARDVGVAVVVTNHVTRDRDSGKLKPALGRSWSFVPSTRIFLDIEEGAGTSGGRRMAYLTKSPRLPTGFQEMVNIETWGTPEQSPTSQQDQM